MATVTHRFVSPLADGPNEDQVQPSNWNDTHIVTINWGDLEGTLSDQIDLQSALDDKLEEVNWGDITGTLSDQTDLQNALNAKLGVAGGTVTGQVVFERSNDNTLVIRDTRNTDNTVVSPLRFEGGNGSGNDVTFRFVLDGANGIKRYDVNFTSGGSQFLFNRDGRLTLGANGSGSTDAVTKQQLENASLGWGQTWQDVTGSRSDNTAYQNTTGKPICVSTFVSATRALEVSTDNSNWVEVANTTTDGGTMQAIVPPNHYYKMNGSFDQWRELR